MRRIAIRSLLLVTFLPLAFPLLAVAQAPAGHAELPPEVRGWLSELDSIHTQLAQLQQQVLRDPELSARQDALGARMRDAMEAVDPTLAEAMNRIPDMEAEAAEAEARGNDARLVELSAEAQQIEQRFMSAQNQALEQSPELVAEVMDFQSTLQARILESDPRAEQLLSRMQELEQMLTETAQLNGH